MSVSVNVRSRGFFRAQKALRNLSHLQLNDLMDNVGSMVEGQVRRRITHQEGPPKGGDWDEYTPAYRRWKDKQGKLTGAGKGFLRLHGELLDSIQHLSTGYQVEVGSNKKYANRMQDQRPYLGLSEQDQDDIEDLTKEWLRDVMRGRA